MTIKEWCQKLNFLPGGEYLPYDWVEEGKLLLFQKYINSPDHQDEFRFNNHLYYLMETNSGIKIWYYLYTYQVYWKRYNFNKTFRFK